MIDMEVERGSFSIFNEAESADNNLWKGIVKRYCGNEPMMMPEYLKLFSSAPFENAFCGWYKNENGGILYPFILREMRALDWCPNALSNFNDVITPYGYGGPYPYGELNTSDVKAFWTGLDAWLKSCRVVSEFIRFSLEISRPQIHYPGDVILKSKNIVRTLDKSLSEMWIDFEHKVRKNVKRAQQNGLRVELDRTGEKTKDFLEIYYSTMARREAKSFYHFGPDFFDKLNRSLDGSFLYFHVLLQNKIISSELTLYSKETIYSYLGGTERSAYNLRPNDLLKYEIIKWGIESGLKRFVIGGGYQGEDGIYKYKKSFAPNGEVPFFVGQRILDSGVYNRLADARRKYEAKDGKVWSPSGGFFPLYRA